MPTIRCKLEITKLMDARTLRLSKKTKKKKKTEFTCKAQAVNSLTINGMKGLKVCDIKFFNSKGQSTIAPSTTRVKSKTLPTSTPPITTTAATTTSTSTKSNTQSTTLQMTTRDKTTESETLPTSTPPITTTAATTTSTSTKSYTPQSTTLQMTTRDKTTESETLPTSTPPITTTAAATTSTSTKSNTQQTTTLPKLTSDKSTGSKTVSKRISTNKPPRSTTTSTPPKPHPEQSTTLPKLTSDKSAGSKTVSKRISTNKPTESTTTSTSPKPHPGRTTIPQGTTRDKSARSKTFSSSTPHTTASTTISTSPKPNPPCADGTYGDGCKSNCSEGCIGICDVINGTCRCKSTWTGATCDMRTESSQSLLAGIPLYLFFLGGTATLLLNILLVISLILCRARRRRKKFDLDKAEAGEKEKVDETSFKEEKAAAVDVEAVAAVAAVSETGVGSEDKATVETENTEKVGSNDVSNDKIDKEDGTCDKKTPDDDKERVADPGESEDLKGESKLAKGDTKDEKDGDKKAESKLAEGDTKGEKDDDKKAESKLGEGDTEGEKDGDKKPESKLAEDTKGEKDGDKKLESKLAEDTKGEKDGDKKSESKLGEGDTTGSETEKKNVENKEDGKTDENDENKAGEKEKEDQEKMEKDQEETDRDQDPSSGTSGTTIALASAATATTKDDVDSATQKEKGHKRGSFFRFSFGKSRKSKKTKEGEEGKSKTSKKASKKKKTNEEDVDGSPTSQPVSRVHVSQFHANFSGDPSALESLTSEFNELKQGLCSAHSVALTEENIDKNRGKSIFPYDNNRVCLEKIGDRGDYINASLIAGPDGSQLYIAAQGPMTNTVEDFLQMLWQYKVPVVVMLTKVTENDQSMCEQYWSDNGEIRFSGWTVSIADTLKLADYTIRTLKIQREDGENRLVKHLQYLEWEESVVPRVAYSVVEFRNRVKSFTSASGPVLTHCSGGVGRTGTFIALDLLIQEAEKQETVDVYACVNDLRTQRVNMVQTKDQYVFLHECLSEALVHPTKFVSVQDLKALEQSLSDTSFLDAKFEKLSCSPKPLARAQIATSTENLQKNRNFSLVPDDRDRIPLKTEVEGRNDYINAVFVSSFKSRQGYIVTQSPLQSTVVDFWRLVYDYNVTRILMLDDYTSDDTKDCGVYWPTSEEPVTFGPFTVSRISVLDQGDLRDDMYKCTLGEETREVRRLRPAPWDDVTDTPAKCSELFKLIDLVGNTESAPLLVHCRDGVSRSGLFCVVDSVRQQVHAEGKVSVDLTIRRVRSVRGEVIRTQTQYNFCYDALLEILKEKSAGEPEGTA